MLPTKPTWVLVAMALLGFVALFVGQLLLDIEALSWTEVTGLVLWFSGILLLVSGVLAIVQRSRGSKPE